MLIVFNCVVHVCVCVYFILLYTLLFLLLLSVKFLLLLFSPINSGQRIHSLFSYLSVVDVNSTSCI